MAVSTISTYSVEEINTAAGGPTWFQLYLLGDRAISEYLVCRAEKAGCTALIVTVDVVGLNHGRDRELAYTGELTEKEEGGFANLIGCNLPDVPTPRDWRDRPFAPMVWEDIGWLRSITKMPIVLKGIQTAEDALLCAEHGVDALVVSNHGGYALPAATATVKVLPSVVEAVGGRIEIYLDGGVRKGTDILKALALGAKAVFIGRPMMWGLAIDGENGVRNVLNILRAELDSAMCYCGVVDLEHVGRDLIAGADGVAPYHAIAAAGGR